MGEARLPGCTHDHVVSVDCHQCTRVRLSGRGQLDASSGKGKAEIVGFNPTCGFAHRETDEIDEILRYIGRARRYVERCSKIAFMIVDWGAHARQRGVACKEVLVPMDADRPLFDQTRTNPVGSFALFTPYRSGPQSQFAERIVVVDGSASVHRHTVPVGKDYATANTADRQVKTVETWLGCIDETLKTLPGNAQLAVRDSPR